MLFLIPFIILALYIGMYLLRSERTSDCRWRQSGKDAQGVAWRCQVCGATALTEKGMPKHCGAKSEE